MRDLCSTQHVRDRILEIAEFLSQQFVHAFAIETVAACYVQKVQPDLARANGTTKINIFFDYKYLIFDKVLLVKPICQITSKTKFY